MVPKWLLTLTISGKFRKSRERMFKYLENEIESYRDETNEKRTSQPEGFCEPRRSQLILTGIKDGLSNLEIAQLIICLLYVGSENTSMLLHAAIIDIAKNPTIWSELYNELCDNPDAVFTSQLLESCILESARLNSNAFAVARSPKDSNKTLGEYHVGNVDQVVICEIMMMIHGDTPYSNPTEYNPKRFMDPLNEPKRAQDILSWGAIVHACPGKNFALYEIKAGIAAMINKFEPFDVTFYGETDYFSTTTFADRKVNLNLKLR